VASINNQVVKTLVAKMHASGLSPKTISNYIGLVKLVVASAVGEDGEELFPRKWNHDFLDLPVIEKQYQPTFSAETMSSIVQKSAGQEQMLYTLLAGSGLRIGEALGLEIKHLSADRKTITVAQSCWNGKMQSPKNKERLQTGRPVSCTGQFVQHVHWRPYLGSRIQEPGRQAVIADKSCSPFTSPDLGRDQSGEDGLPRYAQISCDMVAEATGTGRPYPILAWTCEAIHNRRLFQAGRGCGISGTGSGDSRYRFRCFDFGETYET